MPVHYVEQLLVLSGDHSCLVNTSHSPTAVWTSRPGESHGCDDTQTTLHEPKMSICC